MLAIIGLGGDQRKQTEWLNPAFGSFDDFGHAMLILYIISTGDMWEEFMWAGMDAKAVDFGLLPRMGCDWLVCFDQSLRWRNH